MKNIPNHIAIIMDGNGRWAKKRGLERLKGHEKGADAAMEAIEAANKLGVKHLSLYAFSTENWKRPKKEVSGIMNFSKQVLKNNRDILHGQNIKIKFVGRKTRLSNAIIKEFEIAEDLTKKNTGMCVYFCVNYGGKQEILDAVNKFIERSKGKKITEKQLTKFTYQPDMPPVDLMIRTSGEHRISNFLLWQSSYAEILFLDELFPDFNKKSLAKAVKWYGNRNRRFGGL